MSVILVDDMVFKYNIIKAFEDECAEGKAEGFGQIKNLVKRGNKSKDGRRI